LPGDRESETPFANFPGGAWAFCSDAGTPVVNDPGRALLRWCREREIAVEAVPGPSAPILAWQWSGGFGLPFVFAGFPPRFKSSANLDFRDFFAPAKQAGTFCFFESKHHLPTTLRALADSEFRESRIHIAREMTKPHEELISGSVGEVAALIESRLAADDRFGEATVLLEGRREAGGGAGIAVEDLFALRRAAPKEAAKILARLSGLAVKEVYDRLVREGKESS